MKLNDAKNVLFGNRQVKKIYKGKCLVWPTETPEPPVPPINPEYELLLAIESNSDSRTPYILTDYAYKRNTKVVMECAIRDSVSQGSNLFGNYRSVTGWLVYSGSSTYQSSFRIRTGVSGDGYGTADGMMPNKKYTVTVEKDYASFSGNGKTNIINAVEHESENPVYLQDAEDMGSGEIDTNIIIGGYLPSSIGSRVIIFSCKFYEDGSLVRNFVPVIQKSTNKVGLYDKVLGKFHTVSKYLVNPSSYVPIRLGDEVFNQEV